MDLETLNSMSTDALFELARSMDLDLPLGLERPFIIEELLEAAENALDEDEEEALLNPELTKFDSVALPAEGGESGQLRSQRYNETNFVAILKDPTWAYLYWDIKSEDPPSIEEPEIHTYLLRVLELATPFDPAQNAISWFEFNITSKDSDWNVNLPEDGTSYLFEIDQVVAKKRRVIARSNVISVPRQKTPADFSGQDSRTQRLYELSGLYQYIPSQDQNQTGCRLTSVLDSEF